MIFVEIGSLWRLLSLRHVAASRGGVITEALPLGSVAYNGLLKFGPTAASVIGGVVTIISSEAEALPLELVAHNELL